jgi:hypothetical protein
VTFALVAALAYFLQRGHRFASPQLHVLAPALSFG